MAAESATVGRKSARYVFVHCCSSIPALYRRVFHILYYIPPLVLYRTVPCGFYGIYPFSFSFSFLGACRCSFVSTYSSFVYFFVWKSLILVGLADDLCATLQLVHSLVYITSVFRAKNRGKDQTKTTNRFQQRFRRIYHCVYSMGFTQTTEQRHISLLFGCFSTR